MKDFKRRVIVSAVLERDGKYLLTQQGDGKHKDYWAFPGGGLEINDANLIEAVRREVREEIGVEINEIELLDAQAFVDPEHQIQLVAIFFSCKLQSGEVQHTREIQNHRWVTKEELEKYPRELLRPPVEWFDNLISKL